jgi:hypothetical protein
MTEKKPWTIFDPLPDQTFPDLGTAPSKDLLSGKTSKDLFDDIFGVPKKKYVDETLINKKKRGKV